MQAISGAAGALATRGLSAQAASTAGGAAAGALSQASLAQPSILVSTRASGSGAARPPAWAEQMKRDQSRRAHLQTTGEALKSGDQALGEANPDLEQKD
jgi:type IV secretion system protein TrbL